MTDNWEPRNSILTPEWKAVHDLFEVATRMRESTATFVPLLMWLCRDGTGGMTALAHEPGELSNAVDAGLDMVEEHYGKPAWFAVVVDAYGRITNPEDTTVAAEDLSDRFIMGDEAVVEQLMLLIIFEGQDVRVWRRVYRFSHTDGWEFDRPELMLNHVLPNGNLLGVMRRHGANLSSDS